MMNEKEIEKFEKEIFSRIDDLLAVMVEGLQGMNEDPEFIKKIGVPLSSNEALLCLIGLYSSYVNYIKTKLKSRQNMFEELKKHYKQDIYIDDRTFDKFNEIKEKFITDLANLEKLHASQKKAKSTFASYHVYKDFDLHRVVRDMNHQVAGVSHANIAKETERLSYAYNTFVDFLGQDFKTISFKPNILERAYVCGMILKSLIEAYVNEIKELNKKVKEVVVPLNSDEFLKSLLDINTKIFSMNTIFLIHLKDDL